MPKSVQLPDKFVERLQGQIGTDAFQSFEESFSNYLPVSLRVNPFKPTDQFEGEEDVPWCDAGKYLPKRPLFAKDPLIFAGAYYVQEASSMFLWHALKTHAPLEEDIKVLDLCAAPGGKSTLINSMITPESLLVSNELMPKRLSILVENTVRWGSPNVVVSHNEASDFTPLKSFFDVIAIDAPCSGEGMFRKDPKAIDMWSPGLVNSCANIQHGILEDIMPALKPQGLLVYSTCTFAPQENEERLIQLAESGEVEPLRLPLKEEWGITEIPVETSAGTFYGYRFIFHKTKGEGLFMSCFRKKGDEGRPPKIKIPKKKLSQVSKVNQKEAAALHKWLQQPDEFTFIEYEGYIHALLQEHFSDFKTLNAFLRIANPGTKLGKLNPKNGKLIPEHDLAVSSRIAESIPSIELSYEDAVNYLRKQEPQIDTQGYKDWVKVTYKGIALGWIKVLPNRINNYYPMDLRLRKEF
ncbi:methyltransferase RsmF C-terminal domain-like protein [Algivirga pacifica]|uniref:rRNA cytosine-C5-methyltransferase n=1 Tax=Algivirga pacifica TaxID=1162670 RepID=A0ABP9DAL8_9BACT